MIGATGGSGTRVVARILREAGLFTGTELNESEDAWKLGDYSDRWIDIYLSHRAGALPADVEQAMLDDLATLLREHCAALEPDGRGAGRSRAASTSCRSSTRHLPALRFLHVVRDGRDMALSANQNQLRKHGDAAPIPADLSPPERSIALWSWVNLTAARYGEEQLRDRYLRIRFEDLCARPVDVAASIFEFFELAGDPTAASSAVAAPTSLGRWRAEPPATIAALEEQGGAALVALGYERGDRLADADVQWVTVATVDENQSFWAGYDWSRAGEEWSEGWGGSHAQWYGVVLPRIARFLPASSILEIAPGHGRWTALPSRALRPARRSSTSTPRASRPAESASPGTRGSRTT